VSRIYVPERSFLKDESFYHNQDSSVNTTLIKIQKFIFIDFIGKFSKFYRMIWEAIGLNKIFNKQIS